MQNSSLPARLVMLSPCGVLRQVSEATASRHSALTGGHRTGVPRAINCDTTHIEHVRFTGDDRFVLCNHGRSVVELSSGRSVSGRKANRSDEGTDERLAVAHCGSEVVARIVDGKSVQVWTADMKRMVGLFVFDYRVLYMHTVDNIIAVVCEGGRVRTLRVAATGASSDLREL